MTNNVLHIPLPNETMFSSRGWDIKTWFPLKENIDFGMRIEVCYCVCVCACVGVSVCVCECACACACVNVRKESEHK